MNVFINFLSSPVSSCGNTHSKHIGMEKEENHQLFRGLQASKNNVLYVILSNICPNISVWIKIVDKPTDQPMEPPASMTKNTISTNLRFLNQGFW